MGRPETFDGEAWLRAQVKKGGFTYQLVDGLIYWSYKGRSKWDRCSGVSTCPPKCKRADMPFHVITYLRSELMKKRQVKVSGLASAVLTDKAFTSDYPLIWEHLTATKFDDGTARQTSTLLLFAQDGVLKAMLKDKEAGLCAWVSGATWDGLLTALELALGDDLFEWRQDRTAGQTGAQRTKKK